MAIDMKIRKLSDSEYQLDLWPTLVRALHLDRPQPGVTYLRVMRVKSGSTAWRYVVSVDALRRLLDRALEWKLSTRTSEYPAAASRVIRSFIKRASEVLGE